MAYARFFDSDVYIYTTGERLECCGCILTDDSTPSPSFALRSEMLAHVAAHEAAGHVVNEECGERLRAEIEEYGDEASKNGFGTRVDGSC